jgi:hypothetical protein
MKHIVSFLFSFFLVNFCFGQFTIGTEEIIPNQFYVVHSGLDSNLVLKNTSNIYVIKGLLDTVLIFGTGYGDPSNFPTDTSDIKFYKGAAFDPTQNAMFDANQVDSIITNQFGLVSSNVKLMFIVPHNHLDHINQEFISAFVDSMNYSYANTQILIHTEGVFGATCNSYCCGGSCGNFFGVPFHPSWSPPILSLFQSIGNISDVCNQLLISFNSAVGQWQVLKGDNIHGTQSGNINIDNSNLKYRLQGSGPDNCSIPNDWDIFLIHGNIPVLTTGVLNNEMDDSKELLYPNPIPRGDIITTTVENGSIYSITGEKIKDFKAFQISTSILSPGVYIIKKSDDSFVSKFIVK